MGLSSGSCGPKYTALCRIQRGMACHNSVHRWGQSHHEIYSIWHISFWKIVALKEYQNGTEDYGGMHAHTYMPKMMELSSCARGPKYTALCRIQRGIACYNSVHGSWQSRHNIFNNFAHLFLLILLIVVLKEYQKGTDDFKFWSKTKTQRFPAGSCKTDVAYVLRSRQCRRL